MQQTCKNCDTTFLITEKDQEFYKRMEVSVPTLCPECRTQRRLAFRNDRSLYHSKSALSGKEIITMYNPDYQFTVYDQKEWYSDKWNPLDYGCEFDFNRPFFDQFAELQKKVPRFNVFNLDTENCEYVNYAPHCKNCYLLFGSWFNEDCLYGQTLNECKNCFDNLFVDKSEFCYENIDCNNNYNAKFCQNSSNVTDSYFCFDCQRVQNCIACWNLRDKSYHIFNQPVSKEKFEEEQKKFASYQHIKNFKQKFSELIMNEAIHRDFIGQNNQNVSGNFIFNCKNAKYCFSVYRSEDIAFCGRLFEQKDTYDFDGGGKGELLYENMSNDFSYNSISCTTCEHLNDSHYCDLCFNCQDCFGSVGLRYKKYCILNKQYSEEQYKDLVVKIIKHMKQTKEWGEFFPIKFSPFAYNETLAQEYFPIIKEEADKKGYKWLEKNNNSNVTSISKLPDNIEEVDDNVLQQILVCESCQNNFKIIEKELKFYKRQNLAIAHLCSNCRHKSRMDMRTPRKLWKSNCYQCNKDIETSYDPKRPEKVYCEKCYLKEVY